MGEGDDEQQQQPYYSLRHILIAALKFCPL